jgi:hypothetical protein
MKIKINDKEYGLNWGFGAIRIACDLLDCDYEKMIEMVLGVGDYKVLERSKAISTFILAAIQNYANINNTDSDVSFYQVEAWRDTLEPGDQIKLNEDILKSHIMGKTYGSYLGISTDATASKKKSRSQKSV